MKTKYRYLKILQANYGQYAWEDIGEAETLQERRDLRKDLKAFRDNAPEYAYRIIERREKRES